MFAYDGASPFDLNAAKANSGIVITGYLVGNPGGYSPINKARVDQIRALGMGFSPNWERAADFFLTHSLADCQSAGAEARAACHALGVPSDGTVRTSFSIDAQVPTPRFAEMGDKLHAAGVGLTGEYQTMLYGQSNLIDWLCANHYLTGKHWLMGSTWNQPYAPASPNVCMVQSHDAAGNWINSPVPATDINTVTDPRAIGAWWPAGSPYGEDMPLTQADADLVAKTVWTWMFGAGGKPLDTAAHVLIDASNPPAVPTAAQIVAAIKADPPAGVSLTDAQIQQLAAAIAGATAAPNFTVTLTGDAKPATGA
jgi:hypothetical protein